MTQITKSNILNQIKIYDNIVNLKIGFQKLERKINQVKVDIYTYRYTDFTNFKKYNAFELRGSSVVYDENNNPLRFYFSTPKFFNLNQVDETQLNLIKQKQISKIYEKLDGSLIQFLKINGKILAKSKTSFDTIQAKEAQLIYENTPELKEFIDSNVDNYNLLFEYISYKNKIVVDYDINTLKLIQVRDLEGNYIDVNSLNLNPDFIVKSVDLNLDQILDIVENSTDNIEGYVVYFTDGTIVKFKTLEYLRKHKLLTSDLTKKELVNLVINDTIDDYVSQFQGFKRDILIDFIHQVNTTIIQLKDKISKIDRNLTRKEFAIANKSDTDFALLMQCFDKNDEELIYKSIFKHILYNADNLFKLKEF